MGYQHPIPREIEVTDRFGDSRIIHQTPNGFKLKRTYLTPALVLNQAISGLVGERIRARRTAKGWTLAELATRAGLTGTKQRMWEIENTIRKDGVRLGTLYALALALGCEATDLMPAVSEIDTIAASQKRSVVAVR